MSGERFEFSVDEQDAAAIHAAIAERQRWRAMPDGGGDLRGRVIAEICRGWLEMVRAGQEGGER